MAGIERCLVFLGPNANCRVCSQRKELGVLVYDCSCLALDIHRVFSLYWGLRFRDFIPSFWSKRLFALFNRDQPLELTLNSTRAQAYVSVSDFYALWSLRRRRVSRSLPAAASDDRLNPADVTHVNVMSARAGRELISGDKGVCRQMRKTGAGVRLTGADVAAWAVGL